MSKPIVLAIAAHPDDIEFMMAGTMVLLHQLGCDLHMMNLCNGCLGSQTESPKMIAQRRQDEAQEAARRLHAELHPPICNDVELVYRPEYIEKVASVVRQVRPSILLIHSPEDYMEDHMIACRISVTAAFVRAMPNYITVPPRNPYYEDVTLYHALPYGLRDGLGRAVQPEMFVDISAVVEEKKKALASHKSQKQWLDKTQGIDSYLDTMEEMSREVGRWSFAFKNAEGWRRHNSLGFCGKQSNPMLQLLGSRALMSEDYEKSLDEGISPYPRAGGTE
ncbi:MAG: PIG-L family deacetylase [Candidatus Hydrogenedentes bacterium]|nr:PIG-L family deacetylase [Candidatus Hydrogenedentota bacterium]